MAVTTNYQRGRAYEYKAKKALEELGYTVIRSAGSHGPWDVIACKEGEKVRCIQIKRTKSLPGLRRLLSTFVPVHNGHQDFHYVHELWVWYDARWYYA